MPKIGSDITIEHVLICEDVRKEEGNKQLLIGVYGGNIFVTKFPAILRLAFLLRGTSSKSSPLGIELRLMHNKKSKLMSGEGIVNIEKANTLFSMAVPPIPIEFKKAGTIWLQLRQPGGRWKTVHEAVIEQQELGE